MNCALFLANFHDKAFWLNKPIVCFSGKEYPYYFFLRMIAYLDSHAVLPQQRARHSLFTNTNLDVKYVINLLQQTVLGQSLTYWLGDIGLLFTGKQRDVLLTFLASYQGPNQIIFFTDIEPRLNDGQLVLLPPLLKKTDMHLFVAWYTKIDGTNALAHPKKIELLNHLVTKHQGFSLDACCFLLDYMAVMSVRFIDDLAIYLDKTIASPFSLTVLADSFFLKNRERFFEEWSKVEKEFPPIFWLSYWSDYVWRAYCVVVFLKSNRLLDAKKVGFKLPYSFMSHGWKNYSEKYLATLYQDLYKIDFTLKQGSSFASFELFFLTHFLA